MSCSIEPQVGIKPGLLEGAWEMTVVQMVVETASARVYCSLLRKYFHSVKEMKKVFIPSSTSKKIWP